MSEQILNHRAQHLLKTLIQRYIREGQPVASKRLKEDSALDLSPATVRNVMSDLEQKGYLASPHTSAGKIPTALGFRFFVDSLLTMQSIAQSELQGLEDHFDPDMNTQELLKSASGLLSGVTQQVGVVTLPKQNEVTLRKVEFLPLSGNRVLTILVLDKKEVQNRIIYTDRQYSESELQQASNYINEQFSNKPLTEIRQLLLNALHEDQSNVSGFMQTLVDVADKALTKDEVKQSDYVLQGQNHLVNMADETALGDLRSLFDAFAQKRSILHLFDQALSADGIQIFIGEESGHEALQSCSVITAPYQKGHQVVGVLGVIGPTRMPYERVISVVDVTAKLLSKALSDTK